MIEETQMVKITRIDQKVLSMEAWQKQHTDEDNQREAHTDERFERIFNYIKERHDKTDEKLDTLWDNHNRQDGAMKFAGLVASMIGGIVGSVLTYLGIRHGGS
jgi:hypothetical protein